MVEHLRVGFLGAGLIATYHSKSLRRSGAHATPDFADAVQAHRIVDAMYRSANDNGSSVEVGHG